MSIVMKPDTLQAVLTGMVVGGKGYGISHRWDGSVLTVYSDSGSSSADLLGPQGPQGIAGSVAERLLVTVTKGTDGSYAADTSFGDIEAAIAGGVQPSVKLVGANGESYGQLVSYASGRMVQFSAWLHGGTVDASTVVTVDADDQVYVTYPTEPRVVGVSARKDGSTVTVTVSYADLSSRELVIALNEDGDPVSVTEDGAVCTLTWEGFDA